MIFDREGKALPEYYKEMYLDGYTPEEILQAAHQTMLNQNKISTPKEEVVIRIEEKRK